MGKGDKKTGKGKIFMGSYKNTCPKNAKIREEKRKESKASTKK